MMDAILLPLAVACLAFCGFVALGLAMERHARDVHGRAPVAQRARGLRFAGSGLLVIAFALAVVHAGWGQGPLLWLGVLTACALAFVFGLLPYRPRAVMPGAWLSLCIGIAATAASALL